MVVVAVVVAVVVGTQLADPLPSRGYENRGAALLLKKALPTPLALA